jgi:hypothetical protein
MATELLDIQINIGAKTEDLGAELQKAENLLKKLQAALKKSVDVGEINQLTAKIGTVSGAITQLNSRMGGVQNPTDKATQSLINFSRIAQDAPYGIMGIANNLNPMLESFQQLAKTEGGTKKALTAMVEGLAGPAGIGVALGLVSSLAVVFQKQITEAFQGPAEKLKDLREELKKLNDEIYKMAGSAQASQTLGTQLVGRITNENLDITQRENALRKFKELYGKNKEIKDLEIKDLKTYNAQYLQSLNNKAAVQQLEISKEQNYIDALSAANAKYKKLVEERENKKKNTLATTKQLEAGTTTKMLRSAIDAEYVVPLKEAQVDIANARASLSRTLDITTLFDNSEKETKTKTKKAPIVNYAKATLDDLNDYVKKLKDKVKEAEFVLKNESFKLFELPSERGAKEDKRKNYFEKQAKDLLEQSNQSGFGAYMQGIFKKDKTQLDSEAAEKKRIDDLTQSYAQFAQTLSSNVTNSLFSMYDAMQQGQNPLEALANAFLQIGKNIAAMVIQALIFEKIMNAFPALKGAFAALGLVGNALSGARVAGSIVNAGNANSSFNPSSVANNNVSQGQFVLKGSDLVLATQRANNNLNIRRGY